MVTAERQIKILMKGKGETVKFCIQQLLKVGQNKGFSEHAPLENYFEVEILRNLIFSILSDLPLIFVEIEQKGDHSPFAPLSVCPYYMYLLGVFI